MWRMPGSVSPGATTLERTPRRAPSIASMLESMCTAAFDTEYTAMSTSPSTPASEPMCTMQPRRASRCWKQACAYRRYPRTFTAITRS